MSCHIMITNSFLFDSGDKILEVNNVSLTKVTHSEAVEIFRRATGSKCHLLVERVIFPSTSRPTSSMNNIYPFARPGSSII